VLVNIVIQINVLLQVNVVVLDIDDTNKVLDREVLRKTKLQLLEGTAAHVFGLCHSEIREAPTNVDADDPKPT
jgi:hypothetical protein